MKNHKIGMVLLSICIVLLLAACGSKSQEDVVEKLAETVENMDGYKAEANMTMHTGEESESFDVQVWHQKEDYYRVTLGQDDEERESQIILKNEDGVYVLTPALEKSFRFQTEWPHNSSQPYLFQSLVEDVVGDTEATFEERENEYVFTTVTNYQSNSNLPVQQIHFDKKSYTPLVVKVLDADEQTVVEVNFTEFDLTEDFTENDFALDKNMETEADAIATAQTNEEGIFVMAQPLYTAGAEQVAKKEVDLEDGKRVILTYDGEKNFTLIQESQSSIPTLQEPMEVDGDIINLGFAVAAMDESSLNWTLDGVNYTLASETLTKQEMIDVAQSVQAQQIK